MPKGLAALKENYYEQVFSRFRDDRSLTWDEALALSAKVASASSLAELATLMGFSLAKVRNDLLRLGREG